MMRSAGLVRDDSGLAACYSGNAADCGTTSNGASCSYYCRTSRHAHATGGKASSTQCGKAGRGCRGPAQRTRSSSKSGSASRSADHGCESPSYRPANDHAGGDRTFNWVLRHKIHSRAESVSHTIQKIIKH